MNKGIGNVRFNYSKVESILGIGTRILVSSATTRNRRTFGQMSNSYSHTHSKELSVFRTRTSTHKERKIGY